MDTKENIQNIFSIQSKGIISQNYSNISTRKFKLKKLHSAIIENIDQLSEAIYKDFKKSKPETKLTEIYPVTSEIKHALKNLKRWTKPVKISPPLAFFNSSNKVIYEPKGRVLIIAPWNYPFLLTIGPLVSAIAAGNTVIIKPSENTPHTSAFLKHFISNLFDNSEIAIIEGDYTVAESLLKLPFDHIFFTGSTAVGKKVMSAAANHISSVTLELGGKSPIIIDSTVDLKSTVEKIVWGKFLNCGQTCIAPDYILLPELLLDNFVELFKISLKKLYGDRESIKLNKDYCRIINKTHFERISDLIEDSVNNGAEIIKYGDDDPNELFLAPSLLVNVESSFKIMHEEIFGPALPIITYNKKSELYDILNEQPNPLEVYIFSKQKQFINDICRSIATGTVVINDVVVNFSNYKLPFGGTGYSGIGKAHGYAGFKSFSNEIAIMKQPRYAPSRLLYPPYKKSVNKLIDILIKYF